MMKQYPIRLLTLAAALLGAASGANAMSWARIADVREIVETSATGFRGTVVDQTYREVVVDGRPFPYTETTFQISDCLFGCPANNEMVVRQIGGRFSSRSDRVMLVPGLADYQAGRDYFVFAGGANDDLFGSRFGEHGSLPVVHLDKTAEPIVVGHDGALLQFNKAGDAVTASGLRCQTLDANTVCTDVSGPAAADASADGISAADFAGFIRNITPVKGLRPATLAGRDDFEAALEAFAGQRN